MFSEGRRAQAGEFITGLLYSLVLGGGALLALYLLVEPGGVVALPFILFPAMGLVAFVFVPIALVVMWRAAGRSMPRLLGMLAFLPLLYAAHLSLVGYVHLREWQASRIDYASRTIANPLGPIAVLGIDKKVDCRECWRGLVNGVVGTLVEVSDDPILPQGTAQKVGAYADFGRPTRKPYVVSARRLGHGDECYWQDTTRIRRGVAWLQREGIFDTCIIRELKYEDAPPGTILVLGSGAARRSYGPRFQIAAYRVEPDKNVEIARWEAGWYKRSKITAPGEPFTSYAFVEALTGRELADAFSAPKERTFVEAVDALYSNIDTMPQFSPEDVFVYLTQTHIREGGETGSRGEVSDSTAEHLTAAARVICASPERPNYSDYSKDAYRQRCFESFQKMLEAVFQPEISEELLSAVPGPSG